MPPSVSLPLLQLHWKFRVFEEGPAPATLGASTTAPAPAPAGGRDGNQQPDTTLTAEEEGGTGPQLGEGGPSAPPQAEAKQTEPNIQYSVVSIHSGHRCVCA
jgi:hypothetical protein